MSSVSPKPAPRAGGLLGPGWLAPAGAVVLPFLVDAGVALGFVPFPRAGMHFGATPKLLGLLGCTPQIAFVAVCLLFGSLSDRWGRRRTMVAGMLGYTFAFFLAWQAGSLPALFVAAAVLGAAGGLFWPALEAAVSDVYGHGPLGRGLLLFNVGWTLGMTVGAGAGGRLSDQALALPFLVGMGISAATLPILLIWPPRRKPAAPGSPSPAAWERGLGGEGPPFPAPPESADYFLLLARIANFCSFFALANLRTLFTPLGVTLGFSGTLIGALIAGISLAQAAAFLPVARSRRWQYRLTPLLAAEALIFVALLGTWGATSPAAFALFFTAVGAGCGLTYTASLFYSLNRPSDRGKMGALHEAILGGGAMAGPLLGGALAGSFGLRAPYLLAAAIMAAGILLQLWLHRRRAG